MSSADIYWPADVVPFQSNVTVQDFVERSAATATGFMQTIGRPGSRLQCSMSFHALQGSKRRQLQAAIAMTRGGTRAIYVPDHSYIQSDFHSVSDLAPSINFENGTTGYNAGSSFSFASVDRVIRATRSQSTGTTDGIIRVTNALTVSQFQAYVGRAIVLPVRGPYTGLGLRVGSSSFAADYASITGQSAGMLTLPFVPYVTSVHFGVAQGAVSAMAGDSLEIPFFSVAPCALVDNSPNYLTYSDAFDNAAWSKSGCTITADQGVGPLGTTVMDSLVENGATSSHHVDQAATFADATMDVGLSVDVKANGRNFVRLQISDGTNTVSQYFNLSTGAVGTNGATGTDWADRRAYIRNLGNSIYRCQLIARKTGTGQTTITGRIMAASADGTFSYAGSSSAALLITRGALAAVGVPWAPGKTEGTAAATGTDQPLGGGIYVRGLTAYTSTSELLKRGARVNVNGQMQILEGPLDVDANGRAFLPIPSLRDAPADGTPVIFVNPLMRMIPMESENAWTNSLAPMSDAELVLGEAA